MFENYIQSDPKRLVARRSDLLIRLRIVINSFVVDLFIIPLTKMFV